MSKYIDDLREGLGLANEILIAQRYDCPVISFSTAHAHAFGRWDYRADVYKMVDGQVKRKAIRVDDGVGLQERRRAHRDAAQEWAREKLGVTGEWEPTGLPNSWMPKGAKERMVADLKAWRKEQRAKATEEPS
jgi:hypothetical protein